MAYFNRNSRSGGKGFGKPDFRRNFGENKGFRNNGQGRPFMHKATCAQCGKEAEVPFKPSGDRPIYCSNCFENRGNTRPDNNRFGSERPRFSDNSSKPAQTENGGYKQYKEQFELLNSKLDAIIKALASSASEPQVAPKEIKEKKTKPSLAKSKTTTLKTKKKKAKA